MIITCTYNPALDQTLFVKQVQLGEVNRFRDSQLDPAGKGVNVARMAHRLGWPTIAFGFVGGEIGLIIERALESEGVHYHFTHVPGLTRLNVTVVDQTTERATSFYGPGPKVEAADIDRLNELMAFWLQAGRVLVLSGSLPRGMPADAYATAIQDAKARGVATILDADGEALREGLEAGPTVIKPNRREAEGLLGRHLPDIPSLVDGAREIMGKGVSSVIISLGSEGAIAVDGKQAWKATPLQVGHGSTVGSGDSMVAGLAVALAGGAGLEEGLRLGTAAGAATAMTPGTALGTAEQVRALVNEVRVERVA
jgi:1-phosphofructokinase